MLQDTEIDLLKKKAFTSPTDAKAQRELADAYADRYLWSEAIQAYQASIELAPNAGLWNSIAIAYEEAGDIEEAEKAYRKAIELQPADSSAYYNLGLLYQSQRRIPATIDMLEACLKVSKDSEERREIRSILKEIRGNVAQIVSSGLVAHKERASIINELVQQGWTQETAEELIQYVETKRMVAAKKNRIISKAVAAALVVVVLGVVFCCVLGFPIRLTPILLGGVEDAGLCLGPGTDGNPVGVTSVFSPTVDQIYLYVYLHSNTWINLQFRWYYGDHLIGDFTGRHDPGLSYTWIKPPPGRTFPEGKYRVEIAMWNSVQRTLEFQVQAP